MKTITTSKGEFVVKQYSQDRGKSIAQALLDKFCGRMDGYEFICKISEATEEDAGNIIETLWNGYKNYELDGNVGNYNRLVFKSALESLHSLLKSKGIDINNGNWYLFKKEK